jgi:hypothetical protein
MATLKQNSEALRAITDKLKSLPKRHVLTEVTLTPSKDDVVAVPNDGEAFSKVTVNGDTNLVAENIAEGVEIFGVTGTHSGGGGSRLALKAGGTLTELVAEDFGGVTETAQYAFRLFDTVTKVTFPPTLEILGNNTFYDCKALKEIVFAQNGLLRKIGDSAFSGCDIESITIPSIVNTVGTYAFNGNKKLTSVVFEEGIELSEISNQMFWACSALKSITIPPSVTKMGYQVFKYTALERVVMRPTTPPTIQSSTFDSNAVKTEIIVPIGCGDAYKTATNWSAFADIIVEEGGGTENWLFQNEQVDSSGNNSLPAPVIGNSYTLFVDGEEIATSRAESSWDGSAVLRFNTEDYRIYFIYDASTGMGWHFHPMDSQVQSGSVSIRLNINGGGTND